MSRYTKIEIYWCVEDVAGNDVEYDIECGLTPGDPGCHTMRNGDPGWPSSPAECEILSVKQNGVEVKDWESLKLDQDAIAEKAFEAARDRDEGAREDAAEAAAEARREREWDEDLK